jgi:hypothetical protein
MDDELLANLVAAVEQQLESPRTSYVAGTLRRLVNLGLPEDEAKAQIAFCLGEQSDRMLRSKKPFDEAAYRERLAQLPLPDEDHDDHHNASLDASEGDLNPP